MAASCRSVRRSNPAASCAATETSEEDDEEFPEPPAAASPAMPPIISGAPIMEKLRVPEPPSRLGSSPLAAVGAAVGSEGVRLGSSDGVPVVPPEMPGSLTPRSGSGSGEGVPPPVSLLPVSGGRSAAPLPTESDEPVKVSRSPSDWSTSRSGISGETPGSVPGVGVVSPP